MSEWRADAPVFGLDLDGVVAEFIVWYRSIVADYLKVPAETLTLHPSEMGFAEWGLDADMWGSALAGERAGRYRDIPLVDGAKAGVEALSRAGWRIHVITRRAASETQTGWEGAGLSAAVDTLEWLKRTGIPWDDISFVSDKRMVRADVYLDDDPSIISGLHDAGRQVVVFDRSYNRSEQMRGLPRLFGWEDVRCMLETFAQYYTPVDVTENRFE